ncbi:RAB28, member ras oncogene family, isoform CRA_a [Chytridium lagenaria]|nr:RAB28, member ras oncogene family, isoform CRA_a [Chytridium lagenaria]
MQDEDDTDNVIKIVLLGDGATGKTSIAQRFAQDTLPQNYKQTIGLDFYQKRITLSDLDVGGQTLSSRMTQNYLHGANAIVLVYDVTHIGTFQNLEEWIKLIHKTFLQGVDTMMMDAKDSRLPIWPDLSHIRVVRQDRHLQLASDYNLVPFMASARTGEGVSTTILQIAADLLGVSSKRFASTDFMAS